MNSAPPPAPRTSLGRPGDARRAPLRWLTASAAVLAFGCASGEPPSDLPGSVDATGLAGAPVGAADPAATEVAPDATPTTAGHGVHGVAFGPWAGLTKEWLAELLLAHPPDQEQHETDGHVHVEFDPFVQEEAGRVVEIEMARQARTNGGAFSLIDDLTGAVMDVEYVGVRPPTLKLGHHAYFLVTEARVLGGPDQLVAIDTWLGTETRGGLDILGMRVWGLRESERDSAAPWTTRYERFTEGLEPIMTEAERQTAMLAGPDQPAPEAP